MICEQTQMLLSNSTVAGENPKCDWLCTNGTEAARRVANERGILVENPEEACVIVDTLPVNKWCVHNTPTWRAGQNHVLLDFADQDR